jgi:ATP-dependent helicase/nuclease subunit A
LPQGNGGKVVVWAGRKADDPPCVTDARDAMLEETEHEYRRLLYVAMTRAADRLIVAGCMPGNRNSVRENSWYDLIKRGLSNSDLDFQEIPAGDGVVKSYRRADDAAPETDIVLDSAASTHASLPEWLHTPAVAAPEQIIDPRLRPSDPGMDEGKTFRSDEPVEQRTRALQRGTLVHRLLQSLPDVAAERRRDAALNFLRRQAFDWSDSERETLAAEVLALIGDGRFAAVFGPGSRAEVPIVGRLELGEHSPALVSGQIDRLVVTENEVLIVDFKTNQRPPAFAADVPPAYVRQLALYRALLKKLYPQRTIRAALLWTESTELMEISSPALDAELASTAGGTSKLDPATTRS